jgi:hypothetical protein
MVSIQWYLAVGLPTEDGWWGILRLTAVGSEDGLRR